MHEGYVKIYRKLQNNAIWYDPPKLRLWILCLMKASYNKREIINGNQVVSLNAGQFLTGRNSLENEYNKNLQPKYQQSGKTLWRWLKTLEANRSITIESNNKFSVITINNWTEYNSFDPQLSNNNPSNIHEVSTNNKEKNYKNKNNKTNNRVLIENIINKQLEGDSY